MRHAVASLVARRPAAVVAVLLLVAGVMASGMRTLEKDRRPEAVIPPDDPELVYLERVSRLFGQDDTLFVLVTHERLLEAPQLARVRRLGEALFALPGVADCRSLVTVRTVKGGKDGLSADLLVETSPESPAGVRALRARLQSDPIYGPLLLSRDGRTTTLILTISETVEDVQERTALVEKIEATVAAWRKASPPAPSSPLRVDLTGSFYLKVKIVQALRADGKRFSQASVVVLCVLLYLVLGSVVSVLVALGCVALAAFTALGLMGYLGLAVNLYTMLVPTLILFIGVTDAIHIINRFGEALDRGASPADAARTTVGRIGWACFLTSATTAVGFSTLAASDVPPIRQLGLVAAFGIMAAFVYCIGLVPAVLLLSRQRAPGEFPRVRRLFGRLLSWVARVVTGRTRTVLAACAVLMALTALGLARVDLLTDYTRYLAPDHPAARSLAFAETRLGGTLSLQVVLEGPPLGITARPALLVRLAALEEALLREPAVTSAVSPVTFARLLDGPGKAGGSEDDRAHALLVRFVLMKHAFAPIRRLVTEDETVMRMQLLVRTLDSAAMVDLLGRIRALCARHLGPGVAYRVVGMAPITLRVSDAVIRAQVKSFVVFAAALFVMMLLVLRSLPLALISMPPNLLPILLTGAVMGFLKVPLNSSTALNACIGIGIAVDDTIHFLERYQQERRGGRAAPEAVRATLGSIGRSIVYTSVILASGFGIYTLSSFSNIHDFGIVATTVMVTALLGDLFLLPALLLVFDAGEDRREPDAREGGCGPDAREDGCGPDAREDGLGAG